MMRVIGVCSQSGVVSKKNKTTGEYEAVVKKDGDNLYAVTVEGLQMVASNAYLSNGVHFPPLGAVVDCTCRVLWGQRGPWYLLEDVKEVSAG